MVTGEATGSVWREQMGAVWTSGEWTVNPGREDEFVAAWREMAEWSLREHSGMRAWLLRDRDRSNVFLSIGPWPSDEAVAAWRSAPGFGERVRQIRQLLESFEPRTLDPSVEVG